MACRFTMLLFFVTNFLLLAVNDSTAALIAPRTQSLRVTQGLSEEIQIDFPNDWEYLLLPAFGGNLLLDKNSGVRIWVSGRTDSKTLNLKQVESTWRSILNAGRKRKRGRSDLGCKQQGPQEAVCESYGLDSVRSKSVVVERYHWSLGKSVTYMRATSQDPFSRVRKAMASVRLKRVAQSDGL